MPDPRRPEPPRRPAPDDPRPNPRDREPPVTRDLEDWQQPRFLGDGGRETRQLLGRFSGRGPKGYMRPDERLREEVCDRLTVDGDVDASGIEVSVQDGEVTLEGSVPDRRMKRGAEDCADLVAGVRQVHNRLRVEPR